MSDFFEVHDGNAVDWMSRPVRASIRDRIADLLVAMDGRQASVRREMAAMPRQRILVVGVEVPSRGDAMLRLTAQIAQSRHEVVVSTVPMRPKGKFENIDDAIAAAPRPLDEFDWLIITDDDVKLPLDFTNRYLAWARLADLVVSQPAHCFRSYATYQVTRRRPGFMVRQTSFVEIGPLTVVARKAFTAAIPFPSSRWSYGIDVLWADLCRRNGWRMGMVDALPLRHLEPVGSKYNMTEAVDEGRKLLNHNAVKLNRRDLLFPGQELIAHG